MGRRGGVTQIPLVFRKRLNEPDMRLGPKGSININSATRSELTKWLEDKSVGLNIDTVSWNRNFNNSHLLDIGF